MKSRFDFIGATYEKALRMFPDTRTDDQWILQKLDLNETDKIFEFAAGTGYLTNKICPLIRKGKIIAQDISDVMLEYNKAKSREYPFAIFLHTLTRDLSDIHIANNFFDKVCSLGGFHHIEDQVTVVKNVYKKMKIGGLLCVGDFADNSSTQRYFDERVDKLTITGHQGLFLTESRMVNIGRYAGFSRIETITKKIPFYFDNEESIGKFYQLVHGLNQEPSNTLIDIKKYFDIESQNGKIAVLMDYVYTKYTK